MGLPLADPRERGSGSDGVRDILCCGRAGDTVIWLGDLGGNLPHGANLGVVPPPGGAENHGGAPEDTA